MKLHFESMFLGALSGAIGTLLNVGITYKFATDKVSSGIAIPKWFYPFWMSPNQMILIGLTLFLFTMLYMFIRNKYEFRIQAKGTTNP